MSYGPQPVCMDSVVEGGDPNAIVIGLIVQELDSAKNVVFQWRSWDHFEITDTHAPLTSSLIDYVHGNAVELTHDGNRLICSRALHEITKIDRQTGEVIWRWGSIARKNQFTFSNDPRGFTAQHDVRRLPNGNVTLFDNGNSSSPRYSRAAEYQLDEVNKAATLVWEHRTTPDTFGGFMGKAQRRASGATMIGWGGAQTSPKVTDVRPDGSTAYSLGLPPTTWTYRAFRFPWRTTLLEADADSLDFGSVPVGGSGLIPLSVRNTSAADVTITCFVTTDSAFSVTPPAPLTPGPGGSVAVDVAFDPTQVGDVAGNLYVRSVRETELVAQVVALEGTGGTPTSAAVIEPGVFTLFDGRPNPFEGTTTIRYQIPRAAWVTLEVFDVRGRKVETLVDGPRAAGAHEERWTAGSRPSGLHFYSLTVEGRVATRKLVVIR